MKLYKKKCPICAKIFSYQQYPSVEKANPKATCSKKCAYALSSLHLSGRFIPNGHNEKDKSKWKIFYCKYCSKPFSDQIVAKRVFCSIQCKAKWQRENLKGKNNPLWKPLNQRKPFQSVKRKIRRDLIDERKVCEHCKSTKLLQIHHKDRNRGNNQSSNLLLLCKPCHALEHESHGEFEVARLIRVHPSK